MPDQSSAPTARPSRFARTKAFYELSTLTADRFKLERGEPRAPHLRALLLELAARASAAGEVWHGFSELAEWTGMDARSVNRCLRTLERLGFVAVLPRGYRPPGGSPRWFKTVRLLFGRAVPSEQASPAAAQNSTSMPQVNAHEGAIWRAYLDARARRYKLACAPDEPAAHVLAELAQFVGELASSLAVSFDDAARHAMDAFLSLDGWRDKGLAQSYHRLDWWKHHREGIEQAARQLARRRAAPARARAPEPPSVAPPLALLRAMGSGLFHQTAESTNFADRSAQDYRSSITGRQAGASCDFSQLCGVSPPHMAP